MTSNTNNLPARYRYSGTPVDALKPRELEAALNLANGLDWTPAFKAAGFPERSAHVRASEYRNRSDAKHVQFREALRYLTDQRIAHLAGRAINTLERLMDSPHGPTACRAAVELLNRAGFSPEHRIEVTHLDRRTPAQLRVAIAEELSRLPAQDSDFMLSKLSPKDREAIIIDVNAEPVEVLEDGVAE